MASAGPATPTLWHHRGACVLAPHAL